MLLEFGAERHRIKKAERTFEDGADLVARLQHVDRFFLHQLLQALAKGGFAAANWPQQIDDLLALLEPLRSVPEETDDSLDRLLHAVEVGELGIDLDCTVHENTAEPRLLTRIDHYRLADRAQHPFGCTGIVGWIVRAFAKVILKREFHLAPVFVQP